MAATHLRNVLNARARLGEGCLWNSEQQLLYWLDILNHRVHQFDPATGKDSFFDVGDVVGAIALTEEGQLLLAQRDRLALLDVETGAVTPVLSLEADQPDNRFNDGKCDPRGRFWFGSMNEPGNPEGNLYRYDADGSVHQMETELITSNGLGWSPDAKTFYLTDTGVHKIYAYNFDLETGQISNRRVFVDLTDQSLSPDGLTIDSQGYIWSAMWDSWCVIRFDPDGKEVSRVELPAQCPTCCTFGGANLTDLYITTASVGQSQTEIQRSFYSGDLYCLKTDVAGLPAYSFQSIK